MWHTSSHVICLKIQMKWAPDADFDTKMTVLGSAVIKLEHFYQISVCEFSVAMETPGTGVRHIYFSNKKDSTFSQYNNATFG